MKPSLKTTGVFLLLLTLITSCTSMDVHFSKSYRPGKTNKIVIGNFEWRTINYDPYVVNNFRDAMQFAFFKRGYNVVVVKAPVSRAKKPVSLKELNKRITALKSKKQLPPVKGDILLRGVVSEKEQGDLLDKSVSTIIRVYVYNRNGNKVGEVEHISSSSLSEGIKIKSYAESIVSELDSKFRK